MESINIICIQLITMHNGIKFQFMDPTVVIILLVIGRCRIYMILHIRS